MNIISLHSLSYYLSKQNKIVYHFFITNTYDRNRKGGGSVHYENRNFNQIYDYIIVGSGPTGAIMAKTLSDNQNNSVLLIEAGDNNMNEIPILTSSAETWQYFPQYFWQGRTVRQFYANNRAFNWTTGRTLGGGSSVNGAQYVRPSPQVLEQWESVFGPLWSPEQATHYFTQLENYNGFTNDSAVHGYQGRIHIRQTPVEVPAITEKLVNAISQGTNFPVILDYNDPNTPIGAFYRWQLYQYSDGKRVSAATSFLSHDIMTPDGIGVNGRRLQVFFRTTALKIIINELHEAIGVSFLKEGSHQNAYARKYVIISAGINSSQLLMLSGIGPYETLTNHHIPVVVDNPNVGKNLLNHVLNTASFTVNLNDLPELQNDPFSLYQGGAFLPYPNTSINRRGVQLIGYISNNLLNLLIINLLPISRGQIIIQNNDPLKIAHADYGYLNNALDIEVIKDIFRYYIRNIADQLAAIDPAYRLVSPSYDIINDDLLLENYIRGNVGINYHEQCFNRMAPLQQGGVVDSLGRVYGVNRLIVADSSIIPYPIDSNNSATTYLIGYTIANQLLREDIFTKSYPYPNYHYFT